MRAAKPGRHMIGGERHYIACGMVGMVAKAYGLADVHGQAIARLKTIGHVGDRQFDFALDHPDLLADADRTGPCIV